MSPYQKLTRNPKQLLTLTRIELSEFERLLPARDTAYARAELARKILTIRKQQTLQRQPGGGAPFGNDLPDRCLTLLLYYRLYVSQEFLSLLFKASGKSVICRSIELARAAW